MKIDGVERALAEASERARELLEPADGEAATVGCAVAIFCGREAILGSSGTIDVAALQDDGPGKARLTLEEGESLELAPRFKGAGPPGPEKRMATAQELGGVRMTRARQDVMRPIVFDRADGLDDSARMRVAQRVLETAEELERLIRGAGGAQDGRLAGAVVEALRRSALFGALDADALRLLAPLTREARFEAGAAIPDDPCLHVVATGKVEARRAGHPTRVLGMGDDFGLEAVVRPGERRYEVWALTDVSTITLTRASYEDLAGGHPPLAAAVARAVARRLAERLDEVYDWAAVKA